MTTQITHKNFIPGIGTDQQDRQIRELNPDNLNLMDFGVAEWMKFAWNFADEVNYFNSENEKDGSWRDFFVEESSIKTFLNQIETNSALTPHLTLFVCFLKLLDISKKHFNQLTKRHLDFYYSEILKIEKRASIPDQVHIIFELAKNIAQEKIDENTALDAGKDAKGNKLIYKTQEELIANKATVAELRNVYHHSAPGLKAIKACAVANSFDGLGKAAPSGDPKWFPFGYAKNQYTAETPELPNARIGFAIASPVLLLQEGLRTIQLRLTFQETLDAELANQAEAGLKILISGAKKWLAPSTTNAAILNKTLEITISLDKTIEPIVGYKAAILGENFATTDPIIRFIADTAKEQGYQFATALSSLKLQNIQIQVNVDGIKTMSLENDMGILNEKKPFLPFGPIPVKNARFTIKNQELFSKNWNSLSLKINWMNTPDSFRNQYFAYRTDSLGISTIEKYGKGIYRKAHKLDEFDLNASNLIVLSDNYFKATTSIFSKNEWAQVSAAQVLFSKNGEKYESEIDISNNSYDTKNDGGIQLALNQSFLHEMFPRIYALALQNDKTTPIPKDPYTPMAESVELGYSATVTATFNEVSGQKQVQLFHEHPFGQSEKPSGIVDDQPVCLLPSYPFGGELYIGLKDAEALQQVSLLFQIFEGSENPEADSFAPGEKLEWSILCANKWKILTSNYLISNDTDNFLKSGIVRFSIPAEATTDNTLLPAGLPWIKVRMNKTYDAVCKIIDIKAQAVLAQFDDQNNELSHLINGSPANTIAKLLERKQPVKSVSQPFNSFGGSPTESDQAYYQRISERLRHKNRAITLWDCEHLVLQQFPEVHKVRCLNHTSETSYLAPGCVTLIVIPDIQNKNVFDIYQPRLSKATLNKVQSYINQLNSLHVNTIVMNPEYEEVELTMKVKFISGYDENYYQKVLNEDLTKFLSPWAFEKSVDLQFGTTLHKSAIINYIEKLEYIDFITDLQVKHKGEIKTSVSPSNPKAILVSAKEHQIAVLQAVCSK
jgi:Baseplate J-like protein.